MVKALFFSLVLLNLIKNIILDFLAVLFYMQGGLRKTKLMTTSF